MIRLIWSFIVESRELQVAGVALLLIGFIVFQQVRIGNRGDKIDDLRIEVAELKANVATLVDVNNRQGLAIKESNEAIRQMRIKATQDSIRAVAERDWAMRRFREFEEKYQAVKDQLKQDSTLTWDDLFQP